MNAQYFRSPDIDSSAMCLRSWPISTPVPSFIGRRRQRRRITPTKRTGAGIGPRFQRPHRLRHHPDAYLSCFRPVRNLVHTAWIVRLAMNAHAICNSSSSLSLPYHSQRSRSLSIRFSHRLYVPNTAMAERDFRCLHQCLRVWPAIHTTSIFCTHDHSKSARFVSLFA
jgi:hypothetical protein